MPTLIKLMDIAWIASIRIDVANTSLGYVRVGETRAAMELLGTHHVSFNLLRSAAVQCYALDVAAYSLFVSGTHLDDTKKTKAAYEELLTNHLLSFAIALRTKFYQGLDNRATIPYVLSSGFLFKEKSNKEVALDLSVKDVCDKIIHADSVVRFMEPGVPLPTTTFRGSDRRTNSTWELSMSVSLFVEGVLNWINATEAMYSTVRHIENRQ